MNHLSSEPTQPHFIAHQVSMTDAALLQVRQYMIEEEDPELFLRMYVTGGGCSGLQYGFKFEEEMQEDDTMVTFEVSNLAYTGEGDISHFSHVRLLVDPMSLTYLSGASVDYVDGINGQQFVIRNPNAATTCSCGQSFSDE